MLCFVYACLLLLPACYHHSSFFSICLTFSLLLLSSMFVFHSNIVFIVSALVFHCPAPFLGMLEKPTQLSPFLMLSSSIMISSSEWPYALTVFQKLTNSSLSIWPLESASTWLKNSFAEILPKAFFQCLTASFLSIYSLPSTSKIPKTSFTLFMHSWLNVPSPYIHKQLNYDNVKEEFLIVTSLVRINEHS